MSVKIRLSRKGSKGNPFYSIVVMDSRVQRDGRFIERLGHYDPKLPKDDEKRVILDLSRAKYWISVGAQPTKVIERFLKKQSEHRKQISEKGASS